MTRISTGLAHAVLGYYGLAQTMSGGVIDIYSGNPPEYAHWEPEGIWLGRVTTGGRTFVAGQPEGGLLLDRSTPGALRDTGDWILKGVAVGTAGWWRWKWNKADPNTTDPYYPRVDGVVGECLFLGDPNITPSTFIPIDQFYLRFGGA